MIPVGVAVLLGTIFPVDGICPGTKLSQPVVISWNNPVSSGMGALAFPTTCIVSPPLRMVCIGVAMLLGTTCPDTVDGICPDTKLSQPAVISRNNPLSSGIGALAFPTTGIV